MISTGNVELSLRWASDSSPAGGLECQLGVLRGLGKWPGISAVIGFLRARDGRSRTFFPPAR